MRTDLPFLQDPHRRRNRENGRKEARAKGAYPTNQLNCNVCTKANNLSERDNVAGGGDTMLAAEGEGGGW